MAEDNFEPPRAPLKDPKGPRKTRPNLLAIVIGALVDFVSTMIASVLLGIGYVLTAGTEGMRMEDLQAQMVASDTYLALGSTVGLGCSVLGGYLCARFANQNEYANALAVGIIGIITGELMVSSNVDMWTHLLSLATVPAALLGAHLKMRGDKAE